VSDLGTSQSTILNDTSLTGGGSHNVGYDALPWEMILHGNCGEYGRYSELAVLPDKLARYLFEFASESYTGLALPDIPRNASSGRIHGLMKAHQVRNSFEPCKINGMLMYIYHTIIHITHIFAYYTYRHIYCIYSGPLPPGHPSSTNFW
jgi:hypothetical protein